MWLFSSGPLDDSAEKGEPPLAKGVTKAIARTGARGHATFGGGLAADASGLVASKIAKDRAGDYRNRKQIRDWAVAIAGELREERLPGDRS